MTRELADGGRKPRVDDDEILSVFRSTSDPVLSTAEVADQVPIKRRGTLNRLRALEDSGQLESKQIGGRNTVWWIRDLTSKTPTDGERGNSGNGGESQAPSTSSESRPREIEASPTPEPTEHDTGDESGATIEAGDSDTLEEAVREFLVGRPPKTSHGADVVLSVFRLLRERGTMKTGDLKAELYPAYSEHYGSERAMWESVSRYLDDVPGVEKGGYGEWTYAGDDAVREIVDPDVYDPTTEF